VRRLALAIGIALLAACGATPTPVDTATAEREILDYLRSTYPAITFDEVVCPRDVEAEKDATFVCTAPVGTDTLEIEVTQEDDKGTSITYVPLAAIIQMDQAEIQVGGVVAAQFTGEVAVDCGSTPVRVFRPGTTFECRASDPVGDSKTVRATVKDIDGTLEIVVV